jgi:hypothetical protein
VTPEQANRVAVAERLGQLLLTVRPIEGDGDSERPAAPLLVADHSMPEGLLLADKPRLGGASVFGADVSAALSRDEPAATPRMRVIQGGNVSEVTFR